MKIQLSTTDQQLQVHVQLTNPCREDIFVFDRLFDYYGLLNDPKFDRFKNKKGPPAPHLAYVCLGPKGEAVIFNGFAPQPSGGATSFQPRNPLASRLRADDHYSHHIGLPLPLLEWHAYKSPESEPTRAVQVTAVRYRLEWLRVTDALEPWEIREWPGVWKAYGHPTEFFEATAMLPTPITLLARTDDFARFG